MIKYTTPRILHIGEYSPSLWKVAGTKDAPNNKVATEEKKQQKRWKAMVLLSLIWHTILLTIHTHPFRSHVLLL